MAPSLSKSIRELSDLLPALEKLSPQVERACEHLLSAFEAGGKLMTCGNGGSAADAIHFAEELSVRFQKNRRALAAMSLLDGGAITCAGNDMGYEAVFARQVEALGRPGDVLAGFSTSGNSANVIKAVEAAHAKGMTTIGFLGKDGGKLKGRCTHELIVPHPLTHRVQEGHLIIYHTICEWLDSRVD